MPANAIHAVTGAFGYSGRYLAQRLLDAGHPVITLTNSTQRPPPLSDHIRVFPLAFDQPEQFAQALAGVDVLYNTYWVRFNHPGFSHAQAVYNTEVLFEAARRAGVRRVVHVSITNPSEASPLEYFSGKARLERVLAASGLQYSILRPTVLFGREDILINNIAWALRRFPVFAVFGDGRYRLQPIYVEDLAALAVAEGEQTQNHIIEAIGPETFTYEELVAAVSQAIGQPRRIVHVSPGLGFAASRIISWFMKDVFITREEIRGLMTDLLYVNAPPAGTTKLTDWMRANSATLGVYYANELAHRKTRR